jgi:hypothetical protein
MLVIERRESGSADYRCADDRHTFHDDDRSGDDHPSLRVDGCTCVDGCTYDDGCSDVDGCTCVDGRSDDDHR